MKNIKQIAQQNKQYEKELKWVLAKSRKHGGKIALIALLMLLGSALSLAGSVASKYLVDSLTSHDSRLMWTAGIAMVASKYSMIASAPKKRKLTDITLGIRLIMPSDTMLVSELSR